MEIFVQDRSGLHIVTGNALLQHIQDALRKILIAGFCKGLYHIHAGNAALEYVLGRHQVCSYIPGERVFTSVGIGDRLHLFVGDRRKPQLFEHGLYGLSGLGLT